MTKTGKPATTTSVDDAEATVARLEERRESLLAERLQLESEMGKHSFAAHARSDMKAVAALDEIATKMARIDARLREVDLALAEARERVKAAEAVAAKKAERDRAIKLQKVGAQMVEAAMLADEALVHLIGAGDMLATLVNEIHQLGHPTPNGQQLLSLGERVIVTALMQTIWRRAFPHLAPGERHTFVELVGKWTASLERDIDRVLGGRTEAA
jgi:hypothetical protein